MQRSLDFYLATSGDRSISRVYLSGGTANIRSLLDAIGQRARVSTELLDPLRAAPLGPKCDPTQLQGRAAQAVVSVGLALRKERERKD